MIPERVKKVLPKMKLPSGTGAKIELWTKETVSYSAENGFEDLDQVQTDLSDLVTTNRNQKLKDAVKVAQEKGLFENRRVKNIILMIGDGMGESHLRGSRNFYGSLFMDNLPYYRSATTDCLPYRIGDGICDDDVVYSGNNEGEERLLVTDSSAGGTAILCGERTRYGYIGLDKNGKEIKNLSELARERGMFVGVVTNDHIGDATPACALVHEKAREHEDLIYEKEFKFKPDLLLGADCGIRQYVESEEGKAAGMKGYETFPQMCNEEKKCGYKNKAVSFWDGNFAEYEENTPAGFNMGKNDELPTFPELVAFTLTALDHKAKASNDCGFFCMIENTCCDGWGHAQQVSQIFNEVQCFDEGVAIATKFVLENPDTLLVITADHENADLRFKKNWKNDIDRVVSMDSGHSAQPVPVIAFGAGAELKFQERSLGVTAENFQTGRDIIWLLENMHKEKEGLL